MLKANDDGEYFSLHLFRNIFCGKFDHLHYPYATNEDERNFHNSITYPPSFLETSEETKDRWEDQRKSTRNLESRTADGSPFRRLHGNPVSATFSG